MSDVFWLNENQFAQLVRHLPADTRGTRMTVSVAPRPFGCRLLERQVGGWGRETVALVDHSVDGCGRPMPRRGVSAAFRVGKPD